MDTADPTLVSAKIDSSAETRAVERTDRLDPSLAVERTEKADPRPTKPRMLADEPNLEKPRKLTELPRVRQSKTVQSDPILVWIPAIEKPLPSLTTDRMDTALLNAALPSTEIEDAKRA
jgi:hypothetical protein